MSPIDLSRREFLWSSAAAAGLWSAGNLRSRPAMAASGRIVDEQPWARLEELAEGVWAVASTPLESNDWTTGCNGGLIAGSERVLAIEGFVRPAGAAWLARQAETLTGRRPTDVLITHFHGDHANGIEGYRATEAPRVRATRATLDLIRDEDEQKETPPSEERAAMLAAAESIDPGSPTRLDLGGRTVTLHPRRGHTPSDVTAEIDEPGIVFAGDLVWNGIFPNYRDTEPSAFAESIRALRRDSETIYISGHGTLARGHDVDRLSMLVESVETQARLAHEKGTPVEQAAADYRLPDSVSDWVLFNPKYFEVAFKAWFEELG